MSHVDDYALINAINFVVPLKSVQYISQIYINNTWNWIKSLNLNMLSIMSVLIGIQPIKIIQLIKKFIRWKDGKILVEFF